jgi:hypothetical protein
MTFHPTGQTIGNVASPLPVANGGTASTTASAARTALGVPALAGATFTGYVAPAVVTLTDQATIAVDASAGNDMRVTIGASRNMGAPTNAVNGERITISVTQSGAGSFTITWNSGTGGYEFASSLPAPTLSTAAGTTDVLSFIYDSTRQKWLMVGYVLGFA